MGVDSETKQVFSERLSGFTANPLACTVRICAVDCVETNTFSALEAPDTDYDRYREFLDTEQYPSIEIQTDANGLFEAQLFVPLEFVDSLNKNHRPSFKVVAYITDDVEVFDIQLFEMISPHGISIISDVDDTIKHSDVFKGLYSTLKKALFHDLQDVPGMADSYNLLVREINLVFEASQFPLCLRWPIPIHSSRRCVPTEISLSARIINAQEHKTA
jgi:hypothetical protein